MEAHIKALIEKAAKDTNTSHEAMQYAQAALNAANAMCSIETAKNLKFK